MQPPSHCISLQQVCRGVPTWLSLDTSWPAIFWVRDSPQFATGIHKSSASSQSLMPLILRNRYRIIESRSRVRIGRKERGEVGELVIGVQRGQAVSIADRGVQKLPQSF